MQVLLTAAGVYLAVSWRCVTGNPREKGGKKRTKILQADMHLSLQAPVQSDTSSSSPVGSAGQSSPPVYSDLLGLTDHQQGWKNRGKKTHTHPERTHTHAQKNEINAVWSRTVRGGGVNSTSACGMEPRSGADQPTCERSVLLSAVSSRLRSAELLGGRTCCQHRSAGALPSDAGAVSGRAAEVDVFRGESVQGRAIAAEAAWESLPERRDGADRLARNLRSSTTGARSCWCRERALGSLDVFQPREGEWGGWGLSAFS